MFSLRLQYKVMRVQAGDRPANGRGSRQWIVEHSYVHTYPGDNPRGGMVSAILELRDLYREPIAALRGVAVCSYGDRFDLQTGKVIALERLLATAQQFAIPEVADYIAEVLEQNRKKLERQQQRQKKQGKAKA